MIFQEIVYVYNDSISFVTVNYVYELPLHWEKRSGTIWESRSAMKSSRGIHSKVETTVPSWRTRTKFWPLSSQTYKYQADVNTNCTMRSWYGKHGYTYLHVNLRTESRPSQRTDLPEAEGGSKTDHCSVVAYEEP